MKTVLLLGAGVPRATGPNIALKNRAPLDTDFFLIARAVRKSQADKVVALSNQNRKLHIMDSPEIPISLSWNRGKRRVYMKPIIIPPVSGKRGIMHRDVLALWTKAAAVLQKADRVIVAGYSCPR